jgi:hypothetical protein
LQPDKGHEVLGVRRDVLWGEVLRARHLRGATEADGAGLLQEVAAALPVPIGGVLSAGPEELRRAVGDDAPTLPGVPHQLCQFHSRRAATRPLYDADRHAKTDLKKRGRGVRPRAQPGRSEGQEDPEAEAEAEAVRGYCRAVRSALTEAGRPPLDAPGLTLRDRLQAIDASSARVAEKRGCPAPCSAWTACCGGL